MQILRRNAWLPTVFTVVLVFDLGCSLPPSNSGWPEALGYSSSEVSAIEIDSFGFPNVPVTVAGQVVTLPYAGVLWLESAAGGVSRIAPS
jgi:hypothetical protein